MLHSPTTLTGPKGDRGATDQSDSGSNLISLPDVPSEEGFGKIEEEHQTEQMSGSMCYRHSRSTAFVVIAALGSVTAFGGSKAG